MLLEVKVWAKMTLKKPSSFLGNTAPKTLEGDTFADFYTCTSENSYAFVLLSLQYPIESRVSYFNQMGFFYFFSIETNIIIQFVHTIKEFGFI